jgi:hypothetical protein
LDSIAKKWNYNVLIFYHFQRRKLRRIRFWFQSWKLPRIRSSVDKTVSI